MATTAKQEIVSVLTSRSVPKQRTYRLGLRPSLVRFERVLSIENFGPEPGAKTKLQRINFDTDTVTLEKLDKLFQSFIHSLSTCSTTFCFHVYAQNSLSHSHTLSISHSLTLDMLNNF